MIQFNLLPDVKLEYIKAKKTKRAVIVIAGIVAFTSLSVLSTMLVLVNVVNKNSLSNLSKEIKTSSEEIKKTPDINKILTVQNQLNNLSTLHANKPVATRLSTYVQQVTPSDVTVAKLEVNFVEQAIFFSGSSKTLSSVNQFIDTLKFTEYTLKDADGNEIKEKAFSEVVMDTFERNEKEATYTIKLKYNIAIFDSANKVTLIVPNKVTTRSTVETESLFKPQQKVEQ